MDWSQSIFVILMFCITNVNAFYDQSFDYGRFIGRLTDRDDAASTLKIKVENKNIRFFRAGDALKFSIPSMNDQFCQASIKDVENTQGLYITIFTGNINVCWDDQSIFRRGMQMSFESVTLKERVKAADELRKVFLAQKEDFLIQLNSINNYIYTFQEQMTHTSFDYDKKIALITKEKQEAIDRMLSEKENKIKLQKELVKKLEWIKRQIQFHEVDRIQPITDKWDQDLKMGLPTTPLVKHVKDQ